MDNGLDGGPDGGLMMMGDNALVLGLGELPREEVRAATTVTRSVIGNGTYSDG